MAGGGRMNNMAGYGLRGGFKGRRSSGGRRGNRGVGRASGYGGRSRANGNANRKSSREGVVVYSTYDSKGKRMYVGSTNDPKRRATQHIRTGKLAKGGKLVVEPKRMSRKAAERLEAKKIRGYKRRTGRLPEYNKTADGQYHHRKSN